MSKTVDDLLKEIGKSLESNFGTLISSQRGIQGWTYTLKTTQPPVVRKIKFRR